MLINVYWKRNSDEFIIPTVVKTESGFWLDVEPVETGSLNDRAAFISAISTAIERSGNIVPTPPRDRSLNVALAHSNARSERQFEEMYGQTSITQNPDGSQSVQHYKRAPGGSGRVLDSDLSMTHSPGKSLDQVLDELLEFLKPNHE